MRDNIAKFYSQCFSFSSMRFLCFLNDTNSMFTFKKKCNEKDSMGVHFSYSTINYVPFAQTLCKSSTLLPR